MAKEHKKLYKAGKNWLIATLTITTVTLIGVTSTYKVSADTIINKGQTVQAANINQANQQETSNNSIALSKSENIQGNQSVQDNQSTQSNQNVPTTVPTNDAVNNLDTNIYGTVNVEDWDYQKNNGVLNITDYHGKNLEQFIVPNLNDFNNANVDINGISEVGITSDVLRNVLNRINNENKETALAISKTSGPLNDKVTAENNNWIFAFRNLNCKLKYLDLANLDTNKITSMNEMFVDPYLETVGDLSQWDTSNVTDMSWMFEDAGIKGTLKGLNHWNTSNVTDMSGMFNSTFNLQAVDLSNWDTSNVTNMSHMFNCTGLKEVGNLSNWNTSNVTDMSTMFADTVFKNIGNLSNWDTSNVTSMALMFTDSILRNAGNLSNWNTNNVTNTTDMFKNSHLGYFIAVSKSGKVNNQIEVTDPLAEMSTKGSTIAVIKAPNIYKKIDGKSNAQSVYKVVLALAYQKANEKYSKFYDSLDSKKKLTYPNKVSLRLEFPTHITDQAEIANARFGIDLKYPKIGNVLYIDANGKTVKVDQISGKVGDKINVKLSLPDGYELANKDEQIPSFITVTEDGIKPITINVKKVPGVQTGSINYVDQYGKVIKTDTISGKVGDRINISLSLPNGYELANNEQIPRYITVTEDGIKPITINVKEINTNLANNEVPYDSTTVFNNVNANYGNLDGYRLTENGQGQAQLIASGWHATGASNSDCYRYMIVFDNTLGREIARQKLVPQVRSDVQRAYPNVNDSLYSGFNITIDIPSSSINHSLSLISRYSNDPNNGEGARVDYWFNSLAFNEGNQANLDGISSNGNTLTVNGWHATNQAAGRPYHYIIAWDRSLGHEIARREVTAVSRPDVANVYNTVANAVNSGFSVNFNLTPQFFNDNIQFISRWTDDAAGNGNAVDYWFKPMNRTNRANLDSVALSNGQLQVAGWHATDLSQLEPNHYLIVFDNTTGQQVASEKVDLQSSQDVKNVFGDIQTADHSRFNYTFNSLHLIPGHNYSLVSRYSADATGNGNNGAHTDSWLNMGAFQQSAYFIDNVALNQRHMTVQGWLANDNAMTKPYAYAILIQNGREIGRQRLTLSERDDVAKVYPQIYRSQFSGFNANFDLPTFSTRGLQLVLRFTDDPAGNGNSSDNWINL